MFQESSLHTDALKYAKYLTQFQVDFWHAEIFYCIKSPNLAKAGGGKFEPV